mmetsp:Transcript_43286/g.124108  ORF Transcript_43286/g.124108 Transcript_43286/m.124108 type:complete len:358 (+) Transcript_43286:118-1191(+)
MIFRLLALVSVAAAFKAHVAQDLGSAGSSTQGADAALKQLWSGLELGEESSFSLKRLLSFGLGNTTFEDWFLAPEKRERAVEPKKPTLALMGPFDSGTHLMLYSLIANWPQEMIQACLSPGALDPGREPQMCRHIWKHSLVDKDSVYRVLERSMGDLRNAVLVLLVRSPVSQVLSWKRDPWDLARCMNRSWEEMGRPCVANLRAKPPASFMGITDDADAFQSTADVYNRYVRLYSDLASEGLFRDVKIIAYEEMVMSPAKVLDAIAQALDWPRKDPYKILDGSQKNELGTSRAAAFAKIRQRTYLAAVGAEGVQRLCEGIDTEALAALPASATGFSRGYAGDCDPAALRQAVALGAL